MNSDWKKILILWFISIAISAITLYSFRDVKFKNTKKLAEEYERQQIEIQAEIDAYNETLSETEYINEELPTTWTLSILMPEFLWNSWLELLWQTLNSKWIEINFDYVTNMNDLKWLVEWGLTDYDLYLLPSDWTDWLDLEWIYLWENIKPYYNLFFQNILSDNENTFIPYSIDPLVTMSKNGINNVNSWAWLFSFVTLWTNAKAFAMPLIRGIWENDINLLLDWSGPFENYFEILYWQLNLIKDKHSSIELNNMLDVEKVDLNFKYNYNTFKELYTRITKTNKYCEVFPWNCLLAYNFGDIKFWFLSDFDILNKYFSEKSNNFIISSFTNTDNIYPVRGWWFVMPKWNRNVNLAKQFLMQYILSAIQWSTDLWNSTLPAITNVYEIRKNEDIYKNIIWNEDKFYLFWDSVNLQGKFISDQKNIDLLRWIYSPEIYAW